MSDGDLFEKAIRHACVSGGLRVMSRTDKRVESGLMRAAEHHHRAATRLLVEWVDGLGSAKPRLPAGKTS
jgi:hypothetical protein